MSKLRRLRLKLSSALRRLTGFSTPVGGLSWTPPASEREALRRLIVFLEDRRALFDPYNVEAVVFVEQSVQQIRSELTKTLQSLSETSRAGDPLRTMRAACQRYITLATTFDPQPFRLHPFGRSIVDDGEGDEFILALGELRGAFAACIQQIASAYDIEVHGELAATLPRDAESS